MYANAVSGPDAGDSFANLLYATGDFVPERHWQIVDLGNVFSIIRVRVTNSGGRNANQNISRTDLWNWKVRVLQRLSDLSKPYRSHYLELIACC